MWPAVGVNDIVDGGHQTDGLGQSNNDMLVIGDIVPRPPPTFAVLKPFLTDLGAMHLSSSQFLRGIRIIGCIHDEIIIGAPIAETEIAAQILQQSMVDAGKMYLKDVLVVVEVSVADNWYEK